MYIVLDELLGDDLDVLILFLVAVVEDHIVTLHKLPVGANLARIKCRIRIFEIIVT